ncbi:DUF6694 family lipoprotein [Xenorhabdus hominickii]|uniref:Lipoprotein n=1 Tax=Xenorhabdus hominickii TaxID=351679 RepID=A0A2G0Q8V7_XENHO|nr:DUF6694 family lipoprotein [Xenorhabdus hominickii]AOM41120.1 hypothetical protein A9255_11345 [Xenorhabdus hominickii]PHM55641.1 hypothetical protein Xhom_02389 [Xenorhabdus hominickii]
MKKLLVICLLGFTLTGCDRQLKIDGSNEIAVKTSIEKIRDTLSEDKKLKFDDSLNVTMVNNIDFEALFKNNKDGKIQHSDIEKLEQQFFRSLHGKTADQIIEEAEKIKAISEGTH